MKDPKIKVLVADDSIIMRYLLTDILSETDGFEVVDTATNGKDAFNKTVKHQPDVVLLDINMGQYDGLYATEHIMKECPTPIIILSSIGNTNFETINEALKKGAFDYLNKPVAGGSFKIKDIGKEIIDKIRVASKIKLDNLVTESGSAVPITHPHSFDSDVQYGAIVIGASTGGPKSIESIISHLPANLNMPVLLAQHMPNNFIKSFAARLKKVAALDVQIGTEGDILKPGTIYVAPGDANMIVARKGTDVQIGYTKRTYLEYNHPSVNALMISVARTFGSQAIGIILTGMGRDGALGMKEIKNAGGLTIAESESTCVVFGMPKEAINTGAIDYVIPVNEIGFFVVSSLH